MNKYRQFGNEERDMSKDILTQLEDRVYETRNTAVKEVRIHRFI